MDSFICGICMEEFHDILKFMDHKSQGTYSCGNCGIIFQTRCAISKHIVEVHHGTLISSVASNDASEIKPETANNSETILQQEDTFAHDETGTSQEGHASTVVMQCEESFCLQENTNNSSSSSTIIRLVPVNLRNNAESYSDSETIYAIQQEAIATNSTLQMEEPESEETDEHSADENDNDTANTTLATMSTSSSGHIIIYACKLCERFSLLKEEMSKHLTLVHRISLNEKRFLECVTKLEPLRETAQDSPSKSKDNQNIKQHIMLVPVKSDLQSKTSMVNLSLKLEETETNVPPKKKRGRPKKIDQPSPTDNEIRAKKPDLKNKLESLEKYANGFYHCKNCRKLFSKERHFFSHKCSATSDYIPYSILEDPSNTDDLAEDKEDMDTDFTDELYGIIENDTESTTPSSRGRRGYRRIDKQGRATSRILAATNNHLQEDNASSKNICDNENDNPVTKSGETRVHWRSNPNHVPVFNSLEEKNEFEKHLNSANLSFVDDLYIKHEVPQDINHEMAAKTTGKDYNNLVVFSCTVCKKVFKSLSHTRLHCLIHTDKKPFHCTKCDFASNAKGNVYTHMRKHTGNYFKCTECDFQTINCSHLIEHKNIHSNERHQCKLCLKDYNTVKSLTNHIRRYHSGSKGKEYLAMFKSKVSASLSTLHVCHVCNRKFKKKIDRDVHLFFHNIKTNSKVLQCGLCEYITIKQPKLDNHYRRHRLLYVCCICESIFLSSIKLRNHLMEQHSSDATEALFDESISSSWYLPEPDGTLSLNQYLYIPEELLESQSSEQPEEDTNAAGNTNDTVITDDDKNMSNADEKRLPNVLLSCSLKYKSLTLDLYDKIVKAFGNHECETCGRLFHGRASFENHRMTHGREKPFKCSKCPYSSVVKDNLKRHEEKVHEGRQFSCTECDFVASNKTTIWHHKQKHKPSNAFCEICKENLPSVHILKNHIAKKHPDMDKAEIKKLFGSRQRIVTSLGRPSHKCPYCSRVFHRCSTDLQRHMWVHEGIKPFKCQLCSYTCRKKNSLTEHMHKHSTEKPFTCNECGKNYKSKPALKFHLKLHGQGTVYPCDMCDFKSVLKVRLKKHREVAHNVAKLQYKCEQCEFSAATAAAIKMHIGRKHRDANVDKDVTQTNEVVVEALEKAFRCMSCDFTFDTFANIQMHLKEQHGVAIEAADLGMNDEGTIFLEGTHPLPGEAPTKDQEEQRPSSVKLYVEDGSYAHAVDEKTASAVNVIQRMIEQGTLNSSEGEDGQVMSLAPQSVTLEGGQEFIVKGGSETGEYIVQCITTGTNANCEYVVQTSGSALAADDNFERTENADMEISKTVLN